MGGVLQLGSFSVRSVDDRVRGEASMLRATHVKTRSQPQILSSQASKSSSSSSGALGFSARWSAASVSWRSCSRGVPAPGGRAWRGDAPATCGPGLGVVLAGLGGGRSRVALPTTLDWQPARWSPGGGESDGGMWTPSRGDSRPSPAPSSRPAPCDAPLRQ